MPNLRGRRIVVGVTGSIAAYKSAELISALRHRGAEVWVTMTHSAAELIGEVTLRTLSGRPVALDMWQTPASVEIAHISLAQFAEAMIVAPATANVIGKMAAGIADDLLTTNLLATQCPIVVAPTMNSRMWDNRIVQENLETLRRHGFILVEPEEGSLACGEEGKGRLASIERLLAAVRLALRRQDLGGRDSALAGKRLLLTAGPTREPIDPVRFITNASSGAMGFALALEAEARGAKVTLVHGPTPLCPPPVDEVVPVSSAAEMAEAVFARIDTADVFVGSAAVADYRPMNPSGQKLKKAEGPLHLVLDRTVDIIAEVRQRRPELKVVGFAAETENLEANARDKLQRKGLDLIVANDVANGRAFGPGNTELLLLPRDGEPRSTGRLPKDEAAGLVIDALEELMGQ